MDSIETNLTPTLHIDAYGTKRYYLPDVKTLHREDGPAVENGNGNKEWYINGERHRVDGPALEYSDGYKAWYFNGKHHRVDGPAVEEVNGYKEWWFNGIKYPFEEWDRLRKMLWIL